VVRSRGRWPVTGAPARNPRLLGADSDAARRAARSLYNNIVTPSKLIHGTDFHLFKEGIEPKWEDEKCARGGKWTFCCPKTANRSPLDTYWLNTLLALIGEQFADPGEVCGAVVNVRNKGDRISIWTRTGSNEAAQLSIGKQMKLILDLNETTKLGYMLHDDAIKVRLPSAAPCLSPPFLTCASQLDRKAKDRYVV